jgi:hypothetical protein
VRTCPACGEDTKAGYAERCTECGFSPDDENEELARTPDRKPQITIAEPVKKKKRPALRAVVWLVVLGAAVGADRLGVFDQPTGPDPGQVEEAIADDARQYGVSVTVDCPDDAEDTEAEGTFKCTATSGSGETVTIKVTNHEDTFEWQSGPLSTLA